MEALPFNFVEQNSVIEAVARFTENVKPRFDEFFGGAFKGDAAAIWLEERKSENEDGVCGACRVPCSGGVKAGPGLPTSGELGGLSIGGFSAIVYDFCEPTYEQRPPRLHCRPE